jgi:hypothetical protein
MIDFDSAAPGDRLADVGYALFLWLNLGTDGPPAPEQARRLRVFCDAYGCRANGHVVQAVVEAVRMTVRRLPAPAAPWWSEQLAWLEQNRVALS